MANWSEKSEDLESQFADCFEKMSVSQRQEALHYMQYLLSQSRKIDGDNDARKRVDVQREFSGRPVKASSHIPIGNVQAQADAYQSAV